MKPLLLIGLLACSAAALAGPKVLLETPIALLPGANLPEAVDKDCEVADMLARKVGPALGSINKEGKRREKKKKKKGRDTEAEKPAPATEPPPQVLRLQITQVVVGEGPDAEKAPKSISVKAELLDKGKVLRKARLTRTNTGGFLGKFKGSCSVLEGSATAIGKELSRWAGDPHYKIPGESGGSAKPIANTIPAGPK